CSDTAQRVITVLLDCNSSPVNADFSYSPDTVLMNVIGQANFINLSSGATQYFWDFGGNGTSVETNPTAVFSTPGTYSITLIASNFNCSDTIIKTIVVLREQPIGIFDHVNLIDWRLYPNPVSQELQLLVELAKGEPAQIHIRKINGQMIESFELPFSNRHEWKWNVEKLSAGMYWIEFKTSTGKVIQKFIKL
ncbi:MAG: T9SS type A sorting domain-containing protein, partial [Bacteroidia bacterium]|nr:T9SS type A sorting domain-containing protein [Bacteroidia bacterium]